MSWMPPPPPRNNHESIVAYWHIIADIPENEPGAAILRDMASRRLVELGVVSSYKGDAQPADKA